MSAKTKEQASRDQKKYRERVAASGHCPRHSKEKFLPGMRICVRCQYTHRHLKYHLPKKYGITLADFHRMLQEQRGCCAVCGNDAPGGRGTFHVDHDHRTLKVRGLLCNKCNLLLGWARESEQVLDAAKAYLRKHSEGSFSLSPGQARAVVQGVYSQ